MPSDRSRSSTARASTSAPTSAARISWLFVAIAVRRQFGQQVDVAADLARVRCPGARATPRDVGRESGDRAACFRLVAVEPAEVAIDHGRQRLWAAELRCLADPPRSVSQRRVDGLSHEVLAGLEVPVEPTVRKAGLLHQPAHADVVDPVAANCARRRLHDPFVTRGLICLRAAHGACYSFLCWSRSDSQDDMDHPDPVSSLAGRYPRALVRLDTEEEARHAECR